MYKAENLKQDQVVVQMITLIDRLWKSVNLDLKLTPYNVLATSPDDGLVAFIPETTTLTDVYKNYNRDIRAFFRESGSKKGSSSAASGASEEGLDADILDTFIRTIYQKSKNANLRKPSDSKMNAFSHYRSR